MPLYKSAQQIAVTTPFSDVQPDELVVVMPESDDLADQLGDSDVVMLPSEEQEISLDIPEESVQLSFKLPSLPGADDDEIEVISGEDESAADDNDDEVVVEVEEEKPAKEKDKNDWQSIPKAEFLNWFKGYLDRTPKHRAETVGLERAFSYLKRGLDILSKSVQSDYDGEIDIAKADDARANIEDGMSRLDKELSRRKKKASVEDNGMTKEGRAMGVNSGGVMVTVPLIVSAIARACVNATISNGKDMKDTFNKLAEKYDLSEREKLETLQLLQDMNVIGSELNLFDIDSYGYSSENNIVKAPNYWS